MNLRQKYKREKKRNEELKKWFDSHTVKPEYVHIGTHDVQTLCVEEVFTTLYSIPEEYIEKQLMNSIRDMIKPFVKFEPIFDYESDPYRKRVRATIRVLDCRKD